MHVRFYRCIHYSSHIQAECMIKVIQFNERILIFREINDTTVSKDSWIHSGPHKSSNPQITILFCGTKQMRYPLQKREKRKTEKKM